MGPHSFPSWKSEYSPKSLPGFVLSLLMRACHCDHSRMLKYLLGVEGFNEDWVRAPHSEASGFPGGKPALSAWTENPLELGVQLSSLQNSEEPMTSALGGYVYLFFLQNGRVFACGARHELSFWGVEMEESFTEVVGQRTILFVAEENNQGIP